MDTNIQKSTLNSVTKLKEVTAEQSIDTEFTLPDYYPEISKILKCLTNINVITKQVRGNSIEIGGQAYFTLLYSDKENGINSFSHIYPFVKSVDYGEDLSEAYISCNLRSEYINSKATAPRKIEVHGSVAFTISPIINQNIVCLSNIENDSMYSKCSKIEYFESFLPITKSVFLEDEISIGSNQNSISKIIRSNAVAQINECKVITNKIIVKGQLNVEILYCSQQGIKPLLVTHSHAFSQIVDIDNDMDNIICNAKASVATFELHPKTSLDGEVKSVTFESKVIIDINCDKKTEVCTLTDAFNNCRHCNMTYVSLDAIVDCEKINENYCFNKNLEFSDGAIGDIYDLWCNTRVNFVSCENGEMLIKGVVIINILCSDAKGEPALHERSVDYEYRYSYKNVGSCKYLFDVSIAAINYNINSEGGIDISVELNINCDLIKFKSVSALSDINIEERLINKDDETAVTLYFAEGETVWNIAKKYMSDPNKICIANNIENYDIPCNGILLIPNI